MSPTVRRVLGPAAGVATFVLFFVLAGRIYGSEPTDDLNFVLAGAATMVIAAGVVAGVLVARQIRQR